MNNHLFNCLLSCFSVAIVASCSSESSSFPSYDNGNIINHTASFNCKSVMFGKSRTIIDSSTDGCYVMRWQDTDTIFVALNNLESQSSSIEIKADGQAATFSASFSGELEGNEVQYYAFSPLKAFNNYDFHNHRIDFTIPQVQQSVSSPDSDSQLIWAHSDASLNEMDNSYLQFRHLLAYGHLTINGIPDNKVIKEVSIESDVFLSGDYSYDFENDEITNIVPSKVLHINDTDNDVWFSCLPTQGMKTLTVELQTTDNHIYRKTLNTNGNEFIKASVSSLSISYSEQDEIIYYALLTKKPDENVDWDSGIVTLNGFYGLQKELEDTGENLFLFNKVGCDNDNSSLFLMVVDDQGYPESLSNQEMHVELFRQDNGKYKVFVKTTEGVFEKDDVEIDGKVNVNQPLTRAPQGVSANHYAAATGLLLSIAGAIPSFAGIAATNTVDRIINTLGAVNSADGAVLSFGGLAINNITYSILSDCLALPVAIAGVGFAAIAGSPLVVGIAVAGAAFSALTLAEDVWNAHKQGVYKAYLGHCYPETLSPKYLEKCDYKLGVSVSNSNSIPEDYLGKNKVGLLVKKYQNVSTGMNLYSRNDDSTVPLLSSVTEDKEIYTTFSAEYGWKYDCQSFIIPYCELDNFNDSDEDFRPTKRRSIFSCIYYGETKHFSLPKPYASTLECESKTCFSAVVSCSFTHVYPGASCGIECDGVFYPADAVEGTVQQVTISGLNPGTSYEYQAVMKLNDNTFKGEVMHLSTEPYYPDITGTWTVIVKRESDVHPYYVVCNSDKTATEYVDGEKKEWESSKWTAVVNSSGASASIRFIGGRNDQISQIIYSGTLDDMYNPTKITGKYIWSNCSGLFCNEGEYQMEMFR